MTVRTLLSMKIDELKSSERRTCASDPKSTYRGKDFLCGGGEQE